MNVGIKKKKGGFQKSNRADLIFYICMAAFPVLQFCVFYIGVNFNAMLLVFQKFDVITGKTSFVGFDNIAKALTGLFTDGTLKSSLWNGIGMWFIVNGISIPLGLFFSYYIYKKLFGAGFFRVVLFLPSIISGIVMVAMFQFFVERAIPELVNLLFHSEILGLLENKETRFATLMFYNIWVGFGGSVLYYSNAMSAISFELVEAAKLEGCEGFNEFRYITFPMIFSIFSTFFVMSIAGLFTGSYSLFSFWGTQASTDLSTLGYYLYVRTYLAASKAEYPYLSAIGVCMTFIAVPMTMLVKGLLEKYGPKTE